MDRGFFTLSRLKEEDGQVSPLARLASRRAVGRARESTRENRTLAPVGEERAIRLARRK